MKWMKLRLLDRVTMLSLVLLIGVMALWAWSYCATQVQVPAKLGRWVLQLGLNRGNLYLSSMHLYKTQIVGPALGPTAFSDSNNPALSLWSQRFANRSHSWNGFGFSYEQWPATGIIQGHSSGPYGNAAELGIRRAVQAPFWAIALALAILPGRSAILSLIRRRRDRRLNPKACAQCGYDLRATPDRCPECGVIPQQPPKQ